MSIFNLNKGLNRLEPIKIDVNADPFRNTLTSRSINISKAKNVEFSLSKSPEVGLLQQPRSYRNDFAKVLSQEASLQAPKQEKTSPRKLRILNKKKKEAIYDPQGVLNHRGVKKRNVFSNPETFRLNLN
jgi:hypothetical protein